MESYIIDRHSSMLAEDIQSLLLGKGVDMASFGVGKADTFEQLVHEVRSEQRRLGLEDGILMAWTRPVCVTVQSPDGSQYLLARKQIIAGTGAEVGVRPGIFPAKKTPFDVPDLDALHACMKKELGMDPSDYTVLSGPDKVVKAGKIYESYPQFPTVYFQEFWEVRIHESAFNPNGYVEVSHQGNQTKFVWDSHRPTPP